MKLLIYSDLHLDRRSFNPRSPDGERADSNADVVILAGDIDEGTRGIRWARETFTDKPILYVAGNHEFYGQHWTALLDALREEAHCCEVGFLETDAVSIGGVRFLGCTLWSDFALMGDGTARASMQNALSSMSDFRRIQVTRTAEFYENLTSRLSPEMVLARHRGSVSWLKEELLKDVPERTVVITHHAPHVESVPILQRGHRLSPAYASDLSALMGSVDIWIHGHIHDPVDYLLAGTRVISNPRGDLLKDSRQDHPRFKPGGVWEV
jgi:predicted phosphodiesterase